MVVSLKNLGDKKIKKNKLIILIKKNIIAINCKLVKKHGPKWKQPNANQFKWKKDLIFSHKWGTSEEHLTLGIPGSEVSNDGFRILLFICLSFLLSFVLFYFIGHFSLWQKYGLWQCRCHCWCLCSTLSAPKGERKLSASNLENFMNIDHSVGLLVKLATQASHYFQGATVLWSGCPGSQACPLVRWWGIEVRYRLVAPSDPHRMGERWCLKLE